LLPQLQPRLKQQINKTNVLVAFLTRQIHSNHRLLRLFQFNQNAALHPNRFVLQQQQPKTPMERLFAQELLVFNPPPNLTFSPS
jgi:hypothetical protein